jgi:hypothetical protein
MRLTHVIAALALTACAQAQPAGGWQIDVAAKPAAISAKSGIGAHYGALIFRGGVELKSANPLFGGWSGLEVDADGRFIAISDQGSFLSGSIDTNEAGDLVGVSDAKIGLMRDEKGQPLDGKEWQDAEDIALLHDGRYAVSFERHHRILIYDLAKNGTTGAAERGPPVPQDMAENEGIEALVQAPDGDLIAGREYSATHKAPTQFFKLKLDGSGTVLGPAQVRRDYALVSLRLLPDGDYIALERFYFPMLGTRTALMRYKADGLAAAKPHLDGPELANLKKPLAVDNFEGLAVVPRKDGGARLYIISDDNFSASQRTLLYAFDLEGPKKAKPADK